MNGLRARDMYSTLYVTLVLCATPLLTWTLIPQTLTAQTPRGTPTPSRPQPTQSQIAQRLDSATAATVNHIIDSARGRGLPTEPLIARALEGASRHVAGSRIVAVVRAYSRALTDSREALGDRTKTDELVAGADVLLTGIKTKLLADMRSARGTHPLTVPLVVLADLAARGVPPIDAAEAVLAVIHTNAADAEFFELQRSVASDITRGATPASALALRVQGITNASKSTQQRPKVPVPPATPPIVRHSASQSADMPQTLEFGTSIGVHARAWTQRFSSRYQSWNSYPIQPSLSAGTWVRYGKVVGALSLEQGVDVVNQSRTTTVRGGGLGNSDTLGATPGGDTLPTHGTRDTLPMAHPITDLTASLQWDFGRLETQFFAGARFGNSQAPRARTGGNLAYRLSNGVALTARFEHLPDREIALSRGTNFALGLRLMRMPRLWRRTTETPQASITKFVVTPAHDGVAVIRVRAPKAKSVEIMGDVTGWTATPLSAMGDGWWEVGLSIETGVHHLNIRTDDRPWGPPPGVPAIQNLYETLVGVIIIP